MKTIRVLALCCLIPLFSAAYQQANRYDMVVIGGRLLDGTGDRIYAADIGITDGKIVDVGYLQKEGRRTIDARGYWVTPGFIDMHSHSDYSLLEDGRGLSALYQGVTLQVLGEHTSPGPLLGKAVLPESLTAADFKPDWKTLGQYFERLQKKGIALNVASYVSSGQVRECVLGFENRPPKSSELQEMKNLVAQAMEEGAVGLSSGLSYVPNSYASTEELIELAKVARAHGGIYSSHLRTQGPDPLNGLRECLRIAEAAKIGVEIDHINSTAGSRIADYTQMIDFARKKGLDIEANVYPYTAGMTFLLAHLPEWAQEGGLGKTLLRLKDPTARQKIIAELLAGTTFLSEVSWDKKVISSANPALDGKSIAELAVARHASPEETLLDILVSENGAGLIIVHDNTEENIIRAMKLPWVNFGSDGVALSADSKGSGKPHPRFFGTFPRLIGLYARDKKVMPPWEMVYKMTWMAAKRLDLKDRGKIAPGMAADLVVFHPETFSDLATFEDPAQYSRGIQWLIVNGTPVIDGGKYTGALPGKIIRGPGYRD
jgi:N-acyl-D-amino-acid deacylase